MSDPTLDQACLLQATLPDAGPVYWHAVVAGVDIVERVFAVVDSSIALAEALPAPLAGLDIDTLWNDPQIAPPPASGVPGDPTFPVNIVPGSVPLAGAVEGNAAAVDEIRDLLGMAPFDDGADDTGPHEVARGAMRAWLGSLGLSVAFAGLNAEAPRAGRRPGLPKVSIFFPSAAWTVHTPRQLRAPHTVQPFATGGLAAVAVVDGGLGVPDDVRGALVYDAEGRSVDRVGSYESRFALRFEFARRSQARAVRRELPLALAYAASVGDRGQQGAQRAGVLRLPVTFEGVRIMGEEVSLYFDADDQLAQVTGTATRDRWVLSYSGIATYPWVESGISKTGNELGVRVHLGGTITDLDDLVI